MVRIYRTTLRVLLNRKTNSLCKDGANTSARYSRVSNFRVPQKAVSILAQRVCLDGEVDSQGSVEYPLHYSLNFERFF